MLYLRCVGHTRRATSRPPTSEKVICRARPTASRAHASLSIPPNSRKSWEATPDKTNWRRRSAFLDAPPGAEIRRDGHIRNCSIVAAGQAIHLAGVRWCKPVASIVLGICTEAARLFGPFDRYPIFTAWFYRRETSNLRQESQPVPAPFTNGILEIYDVAAGLASKQSHGASQSFCANSDRFF